METKTVGISFTGLLQIVFIVLKLLGVIEWSWLWVLAPTWIPLAIFLVISIFIFVIPFFVSLIAALFE